MSQPGLPAPSSINALINLHRLQASKDGNQHTNYTLDLTHVTVDEAARLEIDAQLRAINVLSADINRLKLDVPPPPAKPVKNQRSDLVHQAKEQGNAFYKKGQFEEAIKRYTLAIGFASTRPLYENSVYARDELAMNLCNRCAAYMGNNQLEEALWDADATIQIKRPWTKGHFRKGRVLEKMGKLHEAKEALLLGLEFDPEEGDLSKALEDVKAAIRKQQEDELAAAPDH